MRKWNDPEARFNLRATPYLALEPGRYSMERLQRAFLEEYPERALAMVTDLESKAKRFQRDGIFWAVIAIMANGAIALMSWTSLIIYDHDNPSFEESVAFLSSMALAAITGPGALIALFRMIDMRANAKALKQSVETIRNDPNEVDLLILKFMCRDIITEIFPSTKQMSRNTD